MLFQRRRQIKVLIELFQKFTEREAGLANIAFKRVFEGVREIIKHLPSEDGFAAALFLAVLTFHK